ncbi:hypothetical protein EDD16DRAFT_627958 [Pisolithus croceorrhizus]|nr:hypothetical protein EDD16DRAFT_627958 [Pisolithus croceorrhizus]KAI6102548.1 hypothetical protein EV401DRAFT_2023455 [Pisolithus croceorrhizus]
MSDALAELARKVAISACVSLGLMTVEFVWLLRDEFIFIWPGVRFRNLYALVYVLTRYLGLAGQGFNVYFSLRIASGAITSPALCKMWFRYQAMTIQVLLAAMECALMHRIYALFLKNHWVLALLVLLGTSQLASMFVSARLAIPQLAHSDTCYVLKPHASTIYFGATSMTTNLAILFLISWKYLRLPITWTQSPFGHTLLRDSTLSLVAILILLFVMILSNSGVMQTPVNGNVLYYWFYCTLWISLGRLIVNHSKVVQASRGEGVLTQVEVGQTSIWTSTESSTTTHTRMGDSHTIDLTGAFHATDATDKRSSRPRDELASCVDGLERESPRVGTKEKGVSMSRTCEESSHVETKDNWIPMSPTDEVEDGH